MLFMKWFGYANIIAKGNHEQIKTLKAMCDIWHNVSNRMILFKGQANALYYPHPEHRNTGDIDCYLMGDYDRGNEVAEKAERKSIQDGISILRFTI